MYRQSYQRGMLTIFYSVGSKPLALWDTYTQDGYISRLLDQDIKSLVLEIGGTNVSTTYMICPKGNTVLGITMPFLVMIVKNLKKYFSFEVTILDSTGTRRRFRVSNFQSTTQVLPLCTVMPIGLRDGWNQIQFNLAEFTRRAYKKQFIETQKIKINANIRVRRVYFTERIMPEDQLPPEYRLYYPLISKGNKEKKAMTLVIEKEETLKNNSLQLIGEEKKDSGTPVKKSSKLSVRTIKRPSQGEEQIEEDFTSKILAVHEHPLERTAAMTKVPFDTSGRPSQVTAGVPYEDANEGESKTAVEMTDEIVVKKDVDENMESLITLGDNKTEAEGEGYEGDVEVDAVSVLPEEEMKD